MSGQSSGGASATRQKALAVGPTSATRTKSAKARCKWRADEQCWQSGPHGPRWYWERLLQVVPALHRRLVALARCLDVLLDDRLAGEVVLVRAAAAGGAAGALARERLDALVAPLQCLLVFVVSSARLFVGLVKLGAAVLRADAGRDDEERSKHEPFHGYLSGR